MVSIVHSHHSHRRDCHLSTHVRQAGVHNSSRWCLADGLVATHAEHSHLRGAGLIRYDAATHASQLEPLMLLSCHYNALSGAAACPGGPDTLHNSDYQKHRAPLRWQLISP